MQMIGMALVSVVMLAAPMLVRAQVSFSDDSSIEQEVIERRGTMISVRDGVRLAADVYLPERIDRSPVLLAITPYGRGTAALRSKARWFAQRGYVAVVADSRGRYDSDGDWDPFSAKHRTDGNDLVEWLAKQSWSSGKVGMWGASYLGWTQWWTASVAPQHLHAIAPEVAPADQFEGGPYQSGALVGGWVPDWAANMAGRVNQLTDESSYADWQKSRLADFKRTPYKDINTFRGVGNAPWFETWYVQNKSTDDYWNGIAYQGEKLYSKITVPALNVTGWFDVSHSGSPMNYIGMKKFGATPRARRPSLIIGPWTHRINERVVAGIDYGPDATFDVDGYELRWFDRFLKGINNGVDREPPVHVFVMGKNKWRTALDWPLPDTQFTKYYFTSNGRANSIKGDGLLTTQMPSVSGSDTYIYNPHCPTLDPSANDRSPGGDLGGAVDTRLAAISDDVLVYQTPPLGSEVEVIGPIEATLYAATSAKDTDWMVRLVDVHPDGRALLLSDGVIRARNRDAEYRGQFNSAQLSTIKPGEVYEYTIRFWRGTANLFRPGHRIRVEISSSWFPTFLPNLNSGADNLAAVPMSMAVIAHQAIRHGPQLPSHILLPVIQTEASDEKQ